ncbi:hypothetical protein J2809_004061, partial [Arthrobacter pascens]|nr:hypothetical protein [Arthrobacter pascens]
AGARVALALAAAGTLGPRTAPPLADAPG